jgi:hypothetical protein
LLCVQNNVSIYFVDRHISLHYRQELEDADFSIHMFPINPRKLQIPSQEVP